MNKETKNKIVPRLRFPEFTLGNGWTETSLGEVTYPTSQKNREGKKFPIYSINNVEGFLPQSDQFEGVDSHNRGYDISLYKIIQRNTFAYNPARINIGSLGYSGGLNDIIISSLYVCFKTTADLDDLFLLYFLKSESFNKSVKKNVEGGIRSYLFYENFAKINIQYPSLTEQQKIADCLSSLDVLITTQNQKLEALNAHKKGLMQYLIPSKGETLPKLRFAEFKDSGDWEADVLGGENVALFINEKVTVQDLRLESYISTENLLPNYEGKTIASKLPTSGSFTQFKEGDILVSNIRPYLKKVWLASMDGASSNDVIIIRAQFKIHAPFLSFLLKNDDFINYIMKGAEGVKMPRGDKDLIKEYPLAFPKKDEQRKIADCLSSLDEIITAQAEKIGLLTAHKNGLMQQLFPTMNAKPLY